MQLTRFTDYSFRILIHLARNPQGLATIDEIASAHRISRNHLVKVVQRLVACGYVETVRGKGGGMRLARAPEQVGVGDVARDMEENMNVVQCLDDEYRGCALLPSCALKPALVQARESFLATLDRYRLSDLIVARPRQPATAVIRQMPRAQRR